MTAAPMRSARCRVALRQLLPTLTSSKTDWDFIPRLEPNPLQFGFCHASSASRLYSSNLSKITGSSDDGIDNCRPFLAFFLVRSLFCLVTPAAKRKVPRTRDLWAIRLQPIPGDSTMTFESRQIGDWWRHLSHLNVMNVTVLDSCNIHNAQ